MCQIVGGGLTDVRHAERVQHAAEGAPARFLDAVVDVRRAFLRETVELQELLLGDEEDVRGIRDDAAFLQLRD